MTADNVPEHAADAVRQFENELAELRTRRIRFGQLPVPDLPDSEPGEVSVAEQAAQLRAAAESGDAPAELVRIAHAVRQGRTSYEVIVAGDADGLPEVADAKAVARQHFHQLVESGQVRLVLDHNAPAGQPRPSRKSGGDDDDDWPQDAFLEPSWS